MRTVLELRGESCLDLDYQKESRKSLMCGRAFGKTLKELDDIRPALTYFVQNAVARLWKYKQKTSAITVYLSTNSFQKNTAQRCASASAEIETTDDLIKLTSLSQLVLEKAFKSGFQYHKVGILLHDLVPLKTYQTSLFEIESDSQRSHELMKMVEKINTKFGRYTLTSASTSGSSDWKARSKFRSPSFTTCWNQLPVVHA